MLLSSFVVLGELEIMVSLVLLLAVCGQFLQLLISVHKCILEFSTHKYDC